MSDMPITCLVNHDQSYWKLAGITIPNRKQYAERHGYSFVQMHHAGFFGKIDAILESWRDGEWFWWLDVDAVVTNQQREVRSLTWNMLHGSSEGEAAIALTCDGNGLNAGSILYRCVPEVRAVFQEINDRRDEYASWNNNWNDQNGMAFLLYKILHMVRIFDKRVMNSYPNDWQPGDFVLHTPGMSMGDKVGLLRRHV